MNHTTTSTMNHEFNQLHMNSSTMNHATSSNSSIHINNSNSSIQESSSNSSNIITTITTNQNNSIEKNLNSSMNLMSNSTMSDDSFFNFTMGRYTSSTPERGHNTGRNINATASHCGMCGAPKGTQWYDHCHSK